jgi:hypothetical protein
MFAIGNSSTRTNATIVTATTPELALALAMGESYNALPNCLVGVTDLSGGKLAKIVEEPVEIESVEGVIMNVTEDVILVDMIREELNEVESFVTDSEGTWMVGKDEFGVLFMINESEWSYWYGEAGELEIMGAYDRACMMTLRKDFNLIAA